MIHKLVLLTATIAISLGLAGAPAADSDVPAEPLVPQIADAQRSYLSRLARRAVADFVGHKKIYESSYVPAALIGKQFEAVVRIRQDGYLLAEGAGGPLPVHEAVRDAALAASHRGLGNHTLDDVPIDGLLIEIELVGPPQAIPSEYDWTEPRAVDAFVEPGVHGVVIQGPGVNARFCPTEVFTSDLTVADALKTLAERSLSDPSKIVKTKLMRFRSAHWYEPRNGAPIVSLHRGLTIVDQEDVTARGLDDTIARLAEYLAYRQKPSGLFAYSYLPAEDRYDRDDNMVRQAGAVAAAAMHAKWSGKSASQGAADLAIRYHLKGKTDIPGVKDASFIATADGQNKLGVTALLALALAEHPHPDKYADVRLRLINGMRWLQRPSGMFVTAFPPAPRLNAQDYFPGEALLAMAMHYRYQPSADILEAFDLAMDFYRQYFRNTRTPAFVPWQVQAYALMARFAKRQDYVQYVFELTDWLAEKQLTPSNCTWPEMWGGIAAYQAGRAGVATAGYLEGFADALSLARETGDEERSQRYEQVVRGASRFVMQLQVRPEEAYFVRSPRDAIGGVRTTPALNLLRIDHVQHALVGLIKARKVLYPDHD
ncbi:MAG: AMMECR1 domain-containing protein [Planctomycetes bacterium]|nr:AMMECR1 domain-containing protein [Planctomycetota bacterium]